MYTSLAVRHEIKHVGESISVVVSSSQIPHNFKEHFVQKCTCLHLFTLCIESLLFLYYLPTVFHTIDFIELFILYPPTVFHTIDFIELFIDIVSSACGYIYFNIIACHKSFFL